MVNCVNDIEKNTHKEINDNKIDILQLHMDAEEIDVTCEDNEIEEVKHGEVITNIPEIKDLAEPFGNNTVTDDVDLLTRPGNSCVTAINYLDVKNTETHDPKIDKVFIIKRPRYTNNIMKSTIYEQKRQANMSSMLPRLGSLPPNMMSSNRVDNSITAKSLRLHEKKELQLLNVKLSDHLDLAKATEGVNTSVEVHLSRKLVRSLEDELTNVRDSHEIKVRDLGETIRVLKRERTMAVRQNEELKEQCDEIETSQKEANEEIQDLRESISLANSQVAQLENEVKELQTTVGDTMEQVSQTQTDMAIIREEKDILRKSHTKALLAQQETEEKHMQLIDKAEREYQTYTQQVKDITRQLENATKTITQLEEKIEDLSAPDTMLADRIQEIRDAADEELKKYQEEANIQFNRNMTIVRTQIEEDSRYIEKIDEEKTSLQSQVDVLQPRVAELEGMVLNLEHQTLMLEQAFLREQSKAAEQSTALSRKLRHVQEQLFDKLQESNAAHGEFVSIKTEMESLKLLLEREETRIRDTYKLSPNKRLIMPAPLGRSENFPFQQSRSFQVHTRLHNEHTQMNGDARKAFVNNLVKRGQLGDGLTASYEREVKSATSLRSNPKMNEYMQNRALTEIDMRSVTYPNHVPVCLSREKHPPSHALPRHPHATHSGDTANPRHADPCPLITGNDNTSVNRVERSQSTRPDKTTGQPYAGSGPPAHRTGGSYITPHSAGPTIRGNGGFVNKQKYRPIQTEEAHTLFGATIKEIVNSRTDGAPYEEPDHHDQHRHPVIVYATF